MGWKRRKFSTKRRHVPGKMNGLEKRFSNYLNELKKKGKILWWRFEGLKLSLTDADNRTTYTPDFDVFYPDGTMTIFETKGHWTPAARVKTKCAADQWFMFTFIGVQWKKKKWIFEEFEPKEGKC